MGILLKFKLDLKIFEEVVKPHPTAFWGDPQGKVDISKPMLQKYSWGWEI